MRDLKKLMDKVNTYLWQAEGSAVITHDSQRVSDLINLINIERVNFWFQNHASSLTITGMVSEIIKNKYLVNISIPCIRTRTWDSKLFKECCNYTVNHTYLLQFYG